MVETNINTSVKCLNWVALFLSISLLISGSWMSYHTTTASDCDTHFHNIIISVGIFLMVVSLIGLIAVFYSLNWVLFLHLLLLFVLLVMHFGFTIFVMASTSKVAMYDEKSTTQGIGGEYAFGVGVYPVWLQRRVRDDHSWDRIRRCLVGGNLCPTVTGKKKNPPTYDNGNTDFFGDDLSSLSLAQLRHMQSGCCKVPDNCNIKKNNSSTVGLKNPDCKDWSNDSTGLCFNCKSCKAAVLLNLNTRWRSMAIDNVFFIICLITIWSFGCCAFLSNWRDNNSHHQTKPLA